VQKQISQNPKTYLIHFKRGKEYIAKHSTHSTVSAHIMSRPVLESSKPPGGKILGEKSWNV
jgi:hypothetical protein